MDFHAAADGSLLAARRAKLAPACLYGTRVRLHQYIMGESTEFIAVSLLKKDAFSETQLGHLADDPETRFVRRRLDRLPLWSRAIGRYLAAREARALERWREVQGVPRLIRFDRGGLVRSWIDGTPLQQVGRIDEVWAKDARRLLRELHSRRVTHNDLAKPQNWLVTPDGRAALIDLQIATVHRSQGLFYRIARYEDLRHLLKQKKRFAPELLTPTARRMLARRSLPSRFWHATAKPLYNVVTRRLLDWSDNEGAGGSLGPRMEAVREALLAEAGVREVAIVPFPRAGGVGLYAFVETELNEPPAPSLAPDLIQTVRKLPRWPDGRIRSDVLSLIAENRIEELADHCEEDAALATIVKPIADGRLNLSDRYLS